MPEIFSSSWCMREILQPRSMIKNNLVSIWEIKYLILWISLWCCILLEFNLKNWWERNIWEVRYAMERISEFIGKIHGWMNGSEGITCLAYPMTYARDTYDSWSLKNDSCFFKKKILSTHWVLSQWLFHIRQISNFNKCWNLRKMCLESRMTSNHTNCSRFIQKSEVYLSHFGFRWTSLIILKNYILISH